MPCVSYQRPDLSREGPTIAVIVRPSSAFLSAQKEQGSDAEVPSVRSLMLGLQPTGAISIATPSHDHHDVLTYAIDLMLEQNQCHLSDVPVFATGLQNQGIRGLIGRDVLKHLLLVSNGYSSHFTLAVSSPGDTSTPCSPR